MRNIMIASGIFFIVFEQLIFESNNEGLWISFLIFFIIRGILLSYSLYKVIRKNMYV
jgi:Na+-driven multidrug efflux pump